MFVEPSALVCQLEPLTSQAKDLGPAFSLPAAHYPYRPERSRRSPITGYHDLQRSAKLSALLVRTASSSCLEPVEGPRLLRPGTLSLDTLETRGVSWRINSSARRCRDAARLHVLSRPEPRSLGVTGRNRTRWRPLSSVIPTQEGSRPPVVTGRGCQDARVWSSFHVG